MGGLLVPYCVEVLGSSHVRRGKGGAGAEVSLVLPAALVAMPPVTMDPITLRFSSEELERELRASQFKSSFVIVFFLLAGFLAIHVINPLISPKYRIVSGIFLPLIIVCLCARVYLSRHPDQARAHELNSRVWVLILIIGPAAQRLSIYCGWHPRIDSVEATLYMSTYTATCLLLHLQFMEFRYRMFMITCIFLSLSTSGWSITGDPSWTTLGQPFDSLYIGVAVIIGTGMGYLIESMLRTSFLERRNYFESAGASSSNLSLYAEEESELQMDIAHHAFDQLGLIGRGGCADVFLVRKRLTTDGGTDPGPGAGGKLFALKRIVKGRLTSANIRQVEEESCILHRIDHPFLVSLHYSFQSPRCFYFCMSYAPGGDLVRWMEMISADGARTVTAEVLLAVEYLHGTGILYRDVKPENTLVGEDGHVLLADFGVAKRVHRTGAWAPSSSAQPPDLHADVAAADEVAPDEKSRAAALKHTCVGTLEYMCPELFDGTPYSFEVDFWAVAVMLHEMLTGDTIGSIRAPDITAGAWRARPLS